MTSIQQAPADNRNSNDVIGDSLAIGVLFALVLTILQRAVGFIRGIALCRVMPEEELGVWSLAFSFLMLMGPLAVLGLPGTFGRYVESYRLKGELNRFLKKMALACAITTLAFTSVLCAASGFLSVLLFEETGREGLVIALGLSLVGVVLVNFVTSVLEALRQVRLVTLIRFLSGVLFSVGSLVAVLLVVPSALVVTYCFGASCIVGLFPAIWFWKSYKKISTSSLPAESAPSIWKKIAPFAAWMWVVNFMANCFEMADRYMLLKWMTGTVLEAQAAVGQYHSGRVVPLLFVGVATMLAGVLLPYLTASWEAGRKQDIQKQLDLTVKLTGLGFTVCSSLVLMFAPWLFDVVLQGRYSAGLAVLPLTLAYCIWYSLFIVSENFLWLKDKGSFAFAAITIGLVVNILLNAMLIPRYGLFGAVYATGIANVVCLLVLTACNQKFGWRFNYRFGFIMVLPLILLAPILIQTSFLFVLMIACWKTAIVIQPDEREMFESMFGRIANKFGFGKNRAQVPA